MRHVMLASLMFSLSLFRVGRQPEDQAISEVIRIDSRVAVPMRDGVKLYADIYRPRREGKFPVLVVRTPYGVQRDGMHEPKIRFAQRGLRRRDSRHARALPVRRHLGTVSQRSRRWLRHHPVGRPAALVQRENRHGGGLLSGPRPVARRQSCAPEPGRPSSPWSPRPAFIITGPIWAEPFVCRSTTAGAPCACRARIMLPQYWHDAAYVPEELKYETILWHLPLNRGDLMSSESAGAALSRLVEAPELRRLLARHQRRRTFPRHQGSGSYLRRLV